jgi:hypothetical protein
MSDKNSSPQMEAPKNTQPVTLPQLLSMVERACRGEKDLSQQLFSAFMQMRLQPGTPPNERALADVLIQILTGNHQPALDALEEEDIEPVKELIGRLEANGS